MTLVTTVSAHRPIAAGKDFSVVGAFNSSRGGSEALLRGSAASLSFNGAMSAAAGGGTLTPAAVFGGGTRSAIFGGGALLRPVLWATFANSHAAANKAMNPATGRMTFRGTPPY